MKKLLKDKKLWIFLGITLIFFGGMTKVEYSTDSYPFFEGPWKAPFFHFLGLGRFLSGFFWLALCKTNFQTMYVVSYAISLIVTTLSLYKFDELLKREIKSEFLTVLIAILVIINPFSLELMLFYEKAILMLSVLFNILAIKKLDDAFSKHKKKDYILVFAYMILAYFAYQGTVALFVSLAVIYILKYAKNIKDFIIKNVQVGFLYIVPALINLFIIKNIFLTSRMIGTISIKEKILQIWNSLKSLFLTTFDVFPKYFFLVLIIMTIVIILIQITISNKNNTRKIIDTLGLVYIILAIVISTAAPQIMQAWVSIVPRNAYAIGAIIGILLTYLYLNYDKKEILTKILEVMSIILLIMQLISFNEILHSHYSTNFIDKIIANEICDKVHEYEKENQIDVKYIVIYSDENKEILYQNARYYGDVNIKAFANSWGARGVLYLFLQKDLIDDTSNEEKYNKYKENFEGIDYHYFNIDEQVILDEDTLYLCVF